MSAREHPTTLTAVLATTCGLVLGSGLVTAPSAAAKGPQSAVLFSAVTDKTVILTEKDPDIRTLAELLPVWREGGEPSPQPVGRDRVPHTGGQITVLWRGGHDTVFSLDAVLPGYDGETAWVRKEDNLLGRTPHDSWHRADPALLPLLDRLGLYDRAAQPRPPTSEAESTSASGSESLSASGSAATGWWWAGAGLAAGLLLGRVRMPTLRRGLEAPARTSPRD